MKFLELWGPVLVVMALIFSWSGMSDPGAPPGQMSDKTAHLLVYAVLGASLLRALAGGRSAAMTPARIAVAAALAALGGVSDEVHQSFVPERTPELMDLVADAAGGVSGAVLLTLAARGIRRFRAGS